VIEVQGVTHRFGQRTALSDVSLSVGAATVVGLVGPNGAGKSTLMRSIATLLRPERGTIRVDGHDTRGAPAAVRRALGYLPERASPYGDLVAWEYLDLFADIAGLAGAARRQRVGEALALAGLDDRREQLVGQLSKGLKQRLLMQSVLLHRPRALVLDEPTDGLDPESREQVRAQIRALAQAGCAVLVSSHVLEDLEQVANRTVALVQGRLVELGTASRASWVLRLRGDLTVARLVALGASTVSSVAIEGDCLRVALGDGAADPSEATAALVQAGFPVISVSEQAAPLRELYRQAVEGTPS